MITWPDNRKFAFSIFDDTDAAALPEVARVYSFLADLGMRTTKSAWPVRGPGKPVNGGATCDDAEYLDWLLKLQAGGFEIAYHMATYHTSSRADTIRGLDRFRQHFHTDPRAMANHVGCQENIYWGDARLGGVNRMIYNLATHFRNHRKFVGHVPGDAHFWGDVCKDRIRYVRGFTFRELDLLKVCPFMPYHDPERPYVNYWFLAAEGQKAATFNERISEAAQERLEEQGGVAILMTHFAFGFCRNGSLDPRFRALMTRLSRRPAWFAPVSDILDRLLQNGGGHVISPSERTSLERRWLAHKLRTRKVA